MTKYQLHQLLTKQIQYGCARWPDRPTLGQNERSIDLEMKWYAEMRAGAGFHTNPLQIWSPDLPQSEMKEVMKSVGWKGSLLSSARCRARTNLSEVTAQNSLMPLSLAGTGFGLWGLVAPALLSVRVSRNTARTISEKKTKTGWLLERNIIKYE